MRDVELDLSVLQDLSGGDSVYICEVLNIYMEAMDTGLDKLMRATYHSDFESIEKQAHALKSSAGIVKVANMYDELQEVETLGRKREDMKRVYELVISLQEQYSAAISLIEEEIKAQQCKSSS